MQSHVLHSSTYTAPSDLLFVASGLLLVRALLQAAPASAPEGTTTVSLLDCAAVALGFGVLSWVFVAVPLLALDPARCS